MHGGESDSRALKFRSRMEALKRGKELVRVLHGEPRTVVPDDEDRLVLALLAADLDARCGLLRGELPGVAEEVLEQHRNEARVPLSHEPVRNFRFDLALRFSRPQLDENLPADPAHV